MQKEVEEYAFFLFVRWDHHGFEERKNNEGRTKGGEMWPPASPELLGNQAVPLHTEAVALLPFPSNQQASFSAKACFILCKTCVKTNWLVLGQDYF